MDGEYGNTLKILFEFFSFYFQAPEVIRMEEPDPYTFYCDVYSFGVVIFELITAQLPYPHVQERDQVLLTSLLC